MHVGVLSAHVFMHQMHAVLTEARRGCQISRDLGSQSVMSCHLDTGNQTRSPRRVTSALNLWFQDASFLESCVTGVNTGIGVLS